MLRTASSLPLAGLLTLGSDAGRFPPAPPACYRASWQLPGPDFHRQATTSLRTRRNTTDYLTVLPPVLLGARKRFIVFGSNNFRSPIVPTSLLFRRERDWAWSVRRSPLAGRN